LSSASRRGEPNVPYCTLDSNDNLIRHLPESYPVWPLRGSFAFVNDFQKLYMQAKTLNRDFQKRRVTEKLLLEMKDVSSRNAAKFLVALLRTDEEERLHYTSFLKTHAINFIDCVLDPLPPDLIVRGEGHPNGKANTFWANCIAESLDNMLSAPEKNLSADRAEGAAVKPLK